MKRNITVFVAFLLVIAAGTATFYKFISHSYAQSSLAIADANGDGSVTLTDIVVWAMNLEKSVSVGTGGDFNRDAKINIPDLLLWIKTFPYHADPRIDEYITLHAQLPESAVQKTAYKSVPIYDTDAKRMTAEEQTLLLQILAGIPDSLWNLARPNAIIVSTRQASGIPAIEYSVLVAAYAKGPNIYILEETFKGPLIWASGSDPINRSEIRRVIAHELVHTAQYHHTPKEKFVITSIPYDYALSLLNFAFHTGWTQKLIWTLDPTAVTTSYGRNNPVEDMAESLSAFVSGHIEDIDQNRINWMSAWLNEPASKYSQGVIPRFVTLQKDIQIQRVKVKPEHFPVDKVNQYKSLFPIVEFFGWKAAEWAGAPNVTSADFQSYYQNSLPSRGWSGKFTQTGAQVAGEWTYQSEKAYIIILTDFLNDPVVLVMHGYSE